MSHKEGRPRRWLKTTGTLPITTVHPTTRSAPRVVVCAGQTALPPYAVTAGAPAGPRRNRTRPQALGSGRRAPVVELFRSSRTEPSTPVGGAGLCGRREPIDTRLEPPRGRRAARWPNDLVVAPEPRGR